MAGQKVGDVVILLPGILGSELKKNGKDVWSLAAGAVWRALATRGGSITDLAIDQDDFNRPDLGDGIEATGLLQDIHMIPGLWKIDGYTKVRRYLDTKLELVPGENYFEFPYDWRRDNRAASLRLKQKAEQWLSQWKAKSGNRAAKLVLIGHSMGGLVARYFLEVLEGWRNTRALVTFGTPYRGSLNALNFLANGFKKRVGPFQLLDFTALIRSLPSVYQLLPIYPVLDMGGKTVRLAEAPDAVPGLDMQKVKAARAFHDEMAAAVDRNRKDPRYFSDGYTIFPVVGIRQTTLQSASLAGRQVTLAESYFGDDRGGDGTVPRVSATPIELSNDHREFFAAEAHASLQNWEPALVQVEGILSGLDLTLERFRSIAEASGTLRPLQGPQAPIELGIAIDDAFDQHEPIVVKARSNRAEDLKATFRSADREGETECRLAKREDGWHVGQTGPLPPGYYRVTVSGGENVLSVTDVFEVCAS